MEGGAGGQAGVGDAGVDGGQGGDLLHDLVCPGVVPG